MYYLMVNFMPAMELNCAEKEVKKRMEAFYKGTRHLIIGRSANITEPHHDKNQLPVPEQVLERLSVWWLLQYTVFYFTCCNENRQSYLRPFSIVTKILYDKDKKKATGVEILDAETNKTYEFKSKIVFVCASALNSTWVLMNSATDIWEGGLGSSSGELGHNVMDHHFRTGAVAQ